MMPFTYFILFPSIDRLYYGSAVSERRYKRNNIGQEFIGPHHNVEVQRLLDKGHRAIWIKHAEFASNDEAKKYEDKYLKMHWRSGILSDRPIWLLNHKNSATGGNHPAAALAISLMISQGTHPFQREDVIVKRLETVKEVLRSTERREIMSKSSIKRAKKGELWMQSEEGKNCLVERNKSQQMREAISNLRKKEASNGHHPAQIRVCCLFCKKETNKSSLTRHHKHEI